jgi:antitoxin HigA-1
VAKTVTDFKAVRNANRCPSRRGALLNEVIPPKGKTKVELANLLGIWRQQL